MKRKNKGRGLLDAPVKVPEPYPERDQHPDRIRKPRGNYAIAPNDKKHLGKWSRLETAQQEELVESLMYRHLAAPQILQAIRQEKFPTIGITRIRTLIQRIEQRWVDRAREDGTIDKARAQQVGSLRQTIVKIDADIDAARKSGGPRAAQQLYGRKVQAAELLSRLTGTQHVQQVDVTHNVNVNVSQTVLMAIQELTLDQKGELLAEQRQLEVLAAERMAQLGQGASSDGQAE